MPSGRQRAQVAVRGGGLVLVLAWLLSTRLQAAIPFWLPFLILAATELEFVVRGIRESRSVRTEPRLAVLERRLPGQHDADLGWVETTGEDGEPILVPAPPAPRRRSHGLAFAVGTAIAIVLFVAAFRVDTRETWSSLAPETRAKSERRFTEKRRRSQAGPSRCAATTTTSSPASARTRQASPSSAAASPSSSPTSAARCTTSRPGATSRAGKQQRLRSPCSPTRPRTCEESATRRSPSATRCRRARSSACAWGCHPARRTTSCARSSTATSATAASSGSATASRPSAATAASSTCAPPTRTFP